WPHDAREPLQLRCSDGDRSLGVLTDLGHASTHVVQSLRGCHALLLEANHDTGMLSRSSYPAFLRKRIAGPLGHLSNDDAAALLRPIGWMRLYGKQAEWNAALAEAETLKREHGVNYKALDQAGIAAAEPHLLVKRLGAIHWTDPLSVSDPQALTLFYARLFAEAGGRMVHGDAMSLQRKGNAWQVQSHEGTHDAAEVVVALGSASGRLTSRFGYAPPLFGKRGYHRHYRLQGNAVLNHGFLDSDSGFVLVPMRAGVRLTTGAEFAPDDAPKTPVQLARAEPLARGLLPLADAVEAEPWMGVRPCTPDMLPIIGPLPGQQGAWCAFGHAHQGFTLGPTTGRLLAEMMMGET
ncbi:MAG: FAD-dependent oxidoreductase, partial [Acetobacteraceae bacterium]|nr:FAD-dependent oxidoreductase [Acetobacteraceae bacterium]